MRINPGLIALIPYLVAAQSPITITSSQMPTGGDTLRYTNVQLNSITGYAATGPNHNWDFSTAVYAGEGVRRFVPASQTPYFFFGNEFGEKQADTVVTFPGITITNYYDFYKTVATPLNAFVADGAGITINSIPVPSFYTDRDELYIFPLTYPKTDSTTFKFSTPNTTLIPIRYSKQGYRTTKVDGWGTITTPYGTDQCIRLVTTQYSQDTIKMSLLPFPIGFPNNVRSYQWLTLTSKIPFMEVSGAVVGNNFTPTTARYRGAVVRDVGIRENNLAGAKIYPNPATDRLNVITDGTGRVDIADLSGRVLISTHNTSIDVSSLAPGIYFISAEGLQARKFVKE